MKKKKIRKIIGISGAIVIVVFSLLFIGLKTDLITIHHRNDDIESTTSINEIIDKLGVKEPDVFQISFIENVFYDDLEIIGWEFIGLTECDFNVEDVAAEIYRVYNVFKKDNTPTYYIVPEKDGEAMAYIYEYNGDGSLSLLWSEE